MATGLTLHTTCQNHHITLYDAKFADYAMFTGHIEGPKYNLDLIFGSVIRDNEEAYDDKVFDCIWKINTDMPRIRMFMREEIDKTTGLERWVGLIITPDTSSGRWITNDDMCYFTQFDDPVKGVHDG